MKTDNSIPPEKVLGKASSLLDRLQKVLRYQSERFDSETVESFSAESQKALERISMMLADASESCDEAHKLIERARLLLP